MISFIFSDMQDHGTVYSRAEWQWSFQDLKKKTELKADLEYVELTHYYSKK